ncbi:hypothetical protein BDP27DRAFT_1450107 [Rhodocollybia butyracea]|uniref:MalT-like TPR region domain-containing protein n=1 Tax=Rhodocollybia butyracea TaxID=206335 RepID=A0A9P5PHU2_9AGAR|nr:hypothetical protein BDP27DRAFT_1450107 [Rhodocollybia butyracea]
MTCLPCWPKSASVIPSSDDELPCGDVKLKEHKVRNDGDDLGAPSKNEHARETGRMLLEALEAVAEQIPIPGVAIAIKMAKKLIQTCENSHATLQQAEVLKRRIKNLAVILVNELKGKKADEIGEKLRKDIEQLESDLKYIGAKLDEIASQNAFLVILYRQLNEDKVRECVERLATALESFNLSRQIADANALDRLSEQIITFYKQQQVTLDDIQPILAEKKYRGDGLNSSTPRRGVIPVAPNIFFGRDTIVNDFAHTLVSQRNNMARICLLGLEDTLYDSLGVPLNTGDPLRDIIHDLKSSRSPIILLLDNFETPGFYVAKQSEVQEILLQLAKLQHVALFVTMRSFNAPGDSIHWESTHLDAVDKEASTCIYSQIHPAGSKDPQLSSLLDEVGHMPLAITLMAKLGQMMGHSPAELLELYKDAGTALLNLGEESQRSMDICINLSIKTLSQWWAHDIPKATITLGLRTLLDTSLVEKRTDTFVVLPVIRRYVLDPKRFPEDIRKSTVRMACMFLKEHNGSVGKSTYLAHKNARLLEEANLQGVLLETTEADPDIIEALCILSEHQYETRPRLEVAQHALKLSNMSKDQTWYAEALFWYAENLQGTGHHEEAMEQLNLAREAFFHVSEPKRAAHALCEIGQISIHTRRKRVSDLRNALAEFQSLGDPEGIVKCQMLLEDGPPGSEIPVLTDIRAFCISNNLPVQQVRCTQRLTRAFYLAGRLEEAKQWGLIALAELNHLHVWSVSGDILMNLGRICMSLGDLDKAVEYLMESLEKNKAYGSPLIFTRALFHLGRAWMKKGQKEDARGAFMEALKYCELLQGSWEAQAIQRGHMFYFDRLEDPSREPNAEERRSLWNLGVKEDFETPDIAKLKGSETSSCLCT